MAKQSKTKGEVPEVLELNYQLAELPSSQHRAGLAGLILLVQWLEEQGRNTGICEITQLDAYGAILKINQEGLKSLFDEVYAASVEQQERAQPLPDKKHEIQIRTETDPRSGKTKQRTVYLLDVTVPKGAFLLTDDKSPDKDWIKLWRNVIWTIFRGVPATRKPYEDRAAGVATKDAAEAWEQLTQPFEYNVKLPSTYFIGAQEYNAENVPFRDRGRFQFLLHFWPFIAQIYIPAVIDEEGRSKIGTSFALAIPDIANLKTFCRRFRPMLQQRGSERAGNYRPKESVVDLAIESALDFLLRLQERLVTLEGEKSTAAPVFGIDVLQVERQGNNIRLLGTTRLEPDDRIDKYATFRRSFWNPIFRRQRLLNLVKAENIWFAGFDSLMSKTPYEFTIGNNHFRRDARESFHPYIEGYFSTSNLNEENTVTETISENETTTEAKPITTELAIYQLVDTYIKQKLEGKHDQKWKKEWRLPDGKIDERFKSEVEEFEKLRWKIARDAFLAIRSRMNKEDFIEYFVGKICSVSQKRNLNQQAYLKVAEDLFNGTEKIRTLTMLALSARG